jgi:two-component system sensor histidine kinase/response regulator
MNESVHILIIDDSREDRELYVRALRQVPDRMYRFIEAGEGSSGLLQLQRYACDCVLLDYSLPGMNGLGVLKGIREHQPFMPVIMLTGQGNEHVAVEAIKSGAQHYLVKSSITPDLLHRAVQTAITQSALEQSIAEKEQQLKEKTAALELSVNKLLESNCELERFAYICSHDLQEPLRMIGNFTRRLQQHLGDTLDAKGRSYMQFMTEGAARARQLIADVLDYARVEQADALLVPVDSSEVLRDVLHDLSASIEERGATIRYDALPVLHMQPTHLRQLLQNLIGNAIKFCKGPPHVEVRAERDGSLWRFAVKDNGIGIAPEHLPRMFTIFQRLHHRDAYPGTGIGLAVCKKVTQKYGGTIWVESVPGQGSTFFFTLAATENVHESEAA